MTFSETLRLELATAPAADTDSVAAVQARANDILRPPGALARLDEIAVWMAGWQRTDQPDVNAAQVLIFAGDHGVVEAEGVSAFPAEITGAMLAAFQKGVATVNALAAAVGATVQAVDVGVGQPTGNLRVEPAMDNKRFEAAFDAGRQAVASLSSVDLLVVGEMGIGNTTAAAAVAASIAGGKPEQFVGKGTGVADEALANKIAVVADAVARIAQVTDPMQVLQEVGGTELVAMAGAIFEARMRSIPMVLDGYIASASALAMYAFDPALSEHMVAGHLSEEPGHIRVLAHMGLSPIVRLDLRLGEASGAVVAIPIVRMACHAVTKVATFAEWLGDADDAD